MGHLFLWRMGKLPTGAGSPRTNGGILWRSPAPTKRLYCLSYDIPPSASKYEVTTVYLLAYYWFISSILKLLDPRTPIKPRTPDQWTFKPLIPKTWSIYARVRSCTLPKRLDRLLWFFYVSIFGRQESYSSPFYPNFIFSINMRAATEYLTHMPISHPAAIANPLLSNVEPIGVREPHFG